MIGGGAGLRGQAGRGEGGGALRGCFGGFLNQSSSEAGRGS